jgi:CMP/dCMP kinase
MVLRDQTLRDEQDRSREHSPLRAAPGAVEVDTSGLSIDQVVDKIAALVREAR